MVFVHDLQFMKEVCVATQERVGRVDLILRSLPGGVQICLRLLEADEDVLGFRRSTK